MSRQLILDTETGGLDPEKHSLFSIGVVVWENGQLQASDEIFVAEPEFVCEPEAMAVNQIDLNWLKKEGLSPLEAVSRLDKFLDDHFPRTSEKRVPVAGHNVHLDVAFIRRLYRIAGRIEGPRFSHRLLDTASILQYLVLAGRVPPKVAGSSEAFRHFGIEFQPGERHTAIADARATGKLLSRLVDLVRDPDS